MSRDRKLWMVILAVASLIIANLACGGETGEGAPRVTITSPPSGSTVAVGRAVEIVSTATAEAGVARMDLSADGQVVRTDTPPTGNPTTFSIVQPWTPAAAGDVTISVVAYDANGAASAPATITLHVAQEGAAGETPASPPTAEPPAETPAEDVESGGCTLNASYVADVTVPDDTNFAPGAAFVKTWRIRNSGTCDWTAGFKLVFVSGDQMGGPALVGVPATAAGSTADVSVNLTAPGAYGTYRGNWRMQSDEGLAFGSTIYVKIVVPPPATNTPQPTNTPEPTPTDVPPTATPFGGGIGRIAYVSFRDGNAEIYVMGENDAAPTRLTNNPEIDDWPDWAPGGGRIAFSRYSGGKPDVFLMNANGSGQVNLTNNPAWDSNPSWAPDAVRIAFTSDRVGGVIQIWVMKDDGSGATQLTNTPQINSSPAWSPDGNRIAFESNRDGQREIYVMNADGSGQTRLTFTGNNYGPKWSPDGSRIVFSSSNGIWVMKADGTQLMQLTVNVGPLIFDVHPHWSYDGTHIVFDSKRDGNSDLWVVKPDGTGLYKLTTNSAADMNPTWR